ncbi:MAG: hypothetical protein Q8Q09_22050 [Deltaproteobacteria bacterium]|nr:hypothetical protein [Deltaproteobacteria bacterium]
MNAPPLRKRLTTSVLLSVSLSLIANLSACIKSPTSVGGISAPLLSAPFSDSFDRSTLGADWNATGDRWTLREGVLKVSNGHNHPLWLRRRLPHDVRITFDAWSDSPTGDIKCEVFGDGRAFAREASYTATSYVLIHGGWNNRLNVIARMDEHGSDRQVRAGPPVERGRHYHWEIERRGRTLRWSIDGQPMLEFNDPSPLAGMGHEYFAFNNWESELSFDNLVITPL